MMLTSVYDVHDSSRLLYDLLRERDDSVNISHSVLPTWQQHLEFISREPYAAWYLVDADSYVGSVYLTKNNEIGVFILKEHQGHGYGPMAIKLIMELHPRDEFIANINPENDRSIGVFAKLGFTHIQNTYIL